MNNKKFGFTLAEVLITLAIIGVVAALTLPTLISNYKKHEATTKLKRFVATMNQVLQLAQSEYGTTPREWIAKSDHGTQIDEDGQIEQNLTYDYMHKYIIPFMKTVDNKVGIYDGENEDNSTLTTIYFADGSSASFHLGSAVDIIYDLNGEKAPNTEGVDKFTFFIATKDSNSEVPKNMNFAPPYIGSYANTRENAMARCINIGYHCAALLYYDNYEFKPDYPYKL